MKRLFLCLSFLVLGGAVSAAEKAGIAPFKCEGNLYKYTDGAGPTSEWASIGFEMAPASGHVDIDGWWGCTGSDALCKSIDMARQTGGYTFEKQEENANFSSYAALNLRGQTGVLSVQFNRKAKPPKKGSKPVVSWSRQSFNADLKCKVEKVVKG